MDEIKVRNFYNLHGVLQKLFLDEDSSLSLHFICDLLPKLRTVQFIDISMSEMRNNIRQFADAIVKMKENKKGTVVKEVVFRSAVDEDGESDDDIRNEVAIHNGSLNKFRWSYKYGCNGQHHVISLREGGVNAIEAIGGFQEAHKIAKKLKKDGFYRKERLMAMTGHHYFQMSLGKRCLSLQRDVQTVREDESKEAEANGPAKTATMHLTDDLATASTFLFEPCDGDSPNGQYLIHGTYKQNKEEGLFMSDEQHLLGIFNVDFCVVNDDLWFCTIRKSGDQHGGFWFGDNDCVHYETGLSDSTKDVFIMMEVDCPRHGCVMQ